MSKDYKRLTIRNDDGTWGVNYLELANEVAKWQEQHATQYLSTDLTNILGEKLANIEDKIENGILKFIPCKVGEIMYEVIEGMPIQEWKIESISFNSVDPEGVIWAQRTRDYAHWKFWIEDLGTKLFETKAEAQAKLRELKE